MLNTWQRELNHLVKLYTSKWLSLKVKQGYFSSWVFGLPSKKPLGLHLI